MQPLRGVIYKLLAVSFGVVMSSMIKHVSDTIPPGEAVFFRSFFAIPVIVVWLMYRGELGSGLKTKNPLGHFWRGLVGTSGMAFGFASLGLLPLPEVTAISYLAPILVVIFAAMFLNEDVGPYRLGAVALGLVGVGVILAPRLSFESATENPLAMLGVMTALASAVSASLAQVFVRKLTRTEDTATIVFWFSVTATALSLFTIYWGWVIPTPTEAAFLVGAGFLGGILQIFLTSSYRYADASLIAPFDYTSMLFAILIGFFIFDELPTMPTLIGAGIIIAAGIIIILRERHLGIERAKQRKAMTQQG